MTLVLRILIIFSALFYSNLSLAQTCYRGNQDDRRIINSIQQQKDPLTLSFRYSLEAKKSFKVYSDPDSVCNNEPGYKVYRKVSSIVNLVYSDGLAIKKQCVIAGLRREVDKQAYVCGKLRQPQSVQDDIPCVDDYVADYIRFGLNEGIRCVSDTIGRLDTEFIIKKINNESGFIYFMGDGNGVGLGQLTSYPIKDLLGYVDKNKNYQNGNARSIIQSIVDSKSPHCSVFKPLIKGDLERKVNPDPSDKKNICKWVDSGEGLSRNLIYSLAYYAYLKYKVIPSLFDSGHKALENRKIMNYLTLIAYGPEGLKYAKVLAQKMNRKGINTREMERILLKGSRYLADTESKYKELLTNVRKQGNMTVYNPEFSCVE